jgi:hypothetical protein
MMGLVIMVVLPGAVMVFGQVMVRAETVTTPPARKGEFVEYFPAIVATVLHQV